MKNIFLFFNAVSVFIELIIMFLIGIAPLVAFMTVVGMIINYLSNKVLVQ